MLLIKRLLVNKYLVLAVGIASATLAHATSPEAPTPVPESVTVAAESSAAPAIASSHDPASPRPTLVEKLKAQEAVSARPATTAWGDMMMGLMAVLGLILALGWLAKRLRARVPGLSGQLSVVESVALGPRERLCIVETGGKRLLLGVTQQSITVLQTTEIQDDREPSESMFSEKIKKMLQNGAPNGR